MYLKALRQGYVIVRYKYKDINIKATVTVAAYIPRKVSWNAFFETLGWVWTAPRSVCNTVINFWYFVFHTLDPEDTAVVSLGSAKNLILQGGPQPWVHDRSTHYEEGTVMLVRVKVG